MNVVFCCTHYAFTIARIANQRIFPTTVFCALSIVML